MAGRSLTYRSRRQVHGVAGVQVTLWCSTRPRGRGLYDTTFCRPREAAPLSWQITEYGV